MHYYWHGAFDTENLEKFISFLNEKTPTELNIYINSEGGSNTCEEVLLGILQNPNFTLYAVGELSSAAFELFVLAKCKKVLTRNAWAGIHMSAWSAYIRGDHHLDEFAIFQQKFMTEFINKAKKEIYQTLPFTKEELEKIESGGDLYLSYDRLVVLLANIIS